MPTLRASKESAQFAQWPTPMWKFQDWNGGEKIHCAARKMSYHKQREKNTCAECLRVLVGSWPFSYEYQTWMGLLGFLLVQQFSYIIDKSQRAQEKVL